MVLKSQLFISDKLASTSYLIFYNKVQIWFLKNAYNSLRYTFIFTINVMNNPDMQFEDKEKFSDTE